MIARSPASGLQIAVFIGLVEFTIAIATKYLAEAIGWPREFFNLLGNSIAFGIALIVLFGFPSLRARFVGELSKAIPRASRVEVLAVGVAKVAGPFAVMGAMAIYYVSWAPPADLFKALGVASDSAAMDRRYFSVHGLVQATLLALIIGPFVEELIYRGLLYGTWEREWGWVRAMLATSVVFALAHPSTMIPTFIGSMVYVCVLRRTGTLWAPILCHSIYNLLVTWPLLGHVLYVKPRDSIDRLETWTLELACLAFTFVALPAYLWLARKGRGGGVLAT